MARNNLVFGNDAAFKPSSSYAPAPQYNQQPGYSDADLAAMYNRPAATGYDTGRMTWKGVMNAITATLGTIIVVGFGVMILPTVLYLVTGSEQSRELGLAISVGAAAIGGLGGFITVLINGFKRQPSAIVTMLYALFEGLFIGGISLVFERQYPGIVMQAVIGTLAVAGSIVVLYRSGKLRTSPKLTKIFMIAFAAYFLFSIANLFLVWFGVVNLRFGFMGIVIGGVAVLLASYSLVMDLEVISNGVANRAPASYAWRAAMGLAVTLVWMYTEILRILSIARGDD